MNRMPQVLLGMCALLATACDSTTPADLTVSLEFEPDAVAAPHGVNLQWRLVVEWPGGEARSEGPYVSGGSLELPSIPAGSQRQVLVEIFSDNHVYYYGRSQKFEVDDGIQPDINIELVSTPAVGANAMRVIPTAEFGQLAATRHSIVSLSVDGIGGTRMRVSNDLELLARSPTERPLSEILQPDGSVVWPGWNLSQAPCAGDCPRTVEVFARLVDNAGYTSILMRASILFDEHGWSCNGVGQGVCAPTCGDGTVVGDEVCDDGNRIDGDHCAADCSESARCGDGVVQENESCDDGNTIAADGCSSSCIGEAGWICVEASEACRRVIRVDASASSDGDGRSWATAFSALQPALQSAAPGDSIWVAAGSYRPDDGPGVAEGNRDATFQIPEGVRLFGGFAGTEAAEDERNWRTHETTLTGRLYEPGVNVPGSSLHVVTFGDVTNATIFDGFIVHGGYATPDSSTDNQGGGMLVIRGSPVIKNCRFTDNVAGNGGALYAEHGQPTLIDVEFINNTATLRGGAIEIYAAVMSLTGGLFMGNAVDLIDDSEAEGDYSGGGALSVLGSTATLDRVRFFDNLSKGPGGAVRVVRSSIDRPAAATVTSSSFAGNRSTVRGGAFDVRDATLTLINSTVVANCGAFYINDRVAGPPIRECDTLVGDVGGAIASDGVLVIGNSILWGNAPGQIATRGAGTLDLSYTCIEGSASGFAVLASDPLLTSPLIFDPTGDHSVLDLHLQENSPAIDAGDNDLYSASSNLDLSNDARHVDAPTSPDQGSASLPPIDMGAYERQ